MGFTYGYSQCVRIGISQTYGVKIDNNMDGCPGTPHRGHVSSDWDCPNPDAKWLETKRMIISRDQMERIQAILSEE